MGRSIYPDDLFDSWGDGKADPEDIRLGLAVPDDWTPARSRLDTQDNYGRNGEPRPVRPVLGRRRRMTPSQDAGK
jgi:hypothetical protein